MKLRFRENGLRLRLNRPEVARLALGAALEERVLFPGGGSLFYVLETAPDSSPEASFLEGVIRISAPKAAIEPWAADDTIGIYFEVPAGGALLKIAIEKDLECIDLPPEDRDPDAFRRADRSCI
ncbi:MAG: DUF7009 family protein [Bryobacteraceae bacterium]